MSNLYYVNINKEMFDSIKNNKNRCIGVVGNSIDDTGFAFPDYFGDSFFIRSIGVENIFNNKLLYGRFKCGDYVVLTQKGASDFLLDDIGYRTTILISEVVYSRGRFNAPDESSICFYEYDLLTPDYFFNEGDNNGQ
ncbi:hypothetical protein [Xenorhabdus sp. SGI240]|uniref:hypothetical protein n=1 Tax=Xenorhabdus sp. SGI240 TaxID=3158262 RepID=UPI0032B7CFEC